MELSAGEGAEVGGGEVGDHLAEVGEIGGRFDSGEGEVRVERAVLAGDAELGAGRFGVAGELGQTVRGGDAGVEDARVMGIGEPTDAADADGEGAGRGTDSRARFSSSSRWGGHSPMNFVVMWRLESELHAMLACGLSNWSNNSRFRRIS